MAFKIAFSKNGSLTPFFIFIRKYFSSPILARCTHLPFFAQVTFRGAICGSATKAIPVSPMSAKQMAFHVAVSFLASFSISALMLCTEADTIDSII